MGFGMLAIFGANFVLLIQTRLIFSFPFLAPSVFLASFPSCSTRHHLWTLPKHLRDLLTVGKDPAQASATPTPHKLQTVGVMQNAT